MMEFQFPKPQIYLINSMLPDRTENENKFIELELKFKFTTRSRLIKLLNYLKLLRYWEVEYKPALMFIRNENEDFQYIYEKSIEAFERGITCVESSNDYWTFHSAGAGI